MSPEAKGSTRQRPLKGSWRFVISFIVFLALLIYYLKWGSRPSTTIESTPAVVTFDTSKVQRVRIAQPGKPEVIADNENGTWKLAQPYAANADSSSINSMLSTLSGVAPTEKLGPQANAAPFGLNQPSLVEVDLKGGKNYTFEFGSDSPTGGNSYARLQPSKDVLVVPTYVKNDALKSAFDLQDKTVLKISSDKVNKLAIEAKGQKLEFDRKDGKWPDAKKDQIQTLTDALQNAQMNAMTDAAGANATKYGLAHPVYVVTLTTSDGTKRLEVGNKKDNDYYARSSAGPAIFTLSDYVVNDITALTKPTTAATASSHQQKAGHARKK